MQATKVSSGGIAATADFTAIPTALVGVTQINLRISKTAPLGTQPVEITIGDVPSAAVTVTVTR